MQRFRRILWTKNVALAEGELAYGGLDPTVRAREPRRPGDPFELHSTPEDAESLGDPAVGDLVVLTQHGQATHLVEVVGVGVEPRPRRTMRKGTRDARFSFQRTCRLVALHGFDDAPFVEDAFGFDPRNEGGEVFAIGSLPALERSGQPLWAVQRRLERQLDRTPTVRELFLAKKRPAEDGWSEVEAELLGRPMPSPAPGSAGSGAGRGRAALRTSHRPFGPRR